MNVATPIVVPALVRHALTFVGGVLVSMGWLDESTFTEISGAVATVMGVVWSLWSKTYIEEDPT
jgi:hypothetical protein